MGFKKTTKNYYIKFWNLKKTWIKDLKEQFLEINGGKYSRMDQVKFVEGSL